MTSKEFWEDDPDLFISFRTFFVNKQKEQTNYDNTLLWLNGLYNEIAYSTVLSRAFDKNSKAEYPKEPININGKPKISKEKEKEINNNIYQQQVMYIASAKERYLEKIKSQQANSKGV